MTEKCVTYTDDLSDPGMYKLVSHIMTCIEVPVHIYGAWCILFKTSPTMKSVKGLLLWSHFLSALLDITVSFMTIPYVLFPSFAIYTFGVLDYPKVLVIVGLIFCALAVTSILSIYENRYYVLFAKDKNILWCKIRKYFLSLNYFLAVTFVIPLVLAIPDQAYGLQRVTETLGCTPEPYIDGHAVFVVAVDFKPTIACLAFESVSLTVEILAFLFTIFAKLSLQDKTKTASNRTRQFQKRFVIAICLQTLVPVALLMSPVFYVLTTVLLNYRNQTLINLCFLIGSSHGVLSTIVMVFIHQPYRDATFDLGCFLIGKRGRRRTKTSGPHSSVVRI
ncbi:unnamed protein product [Caenorhabditis brenneri]